MTLHVERPRDELLARPVLAVDQDSAVRGSRHGDLLAQPEHDAALPNHRLLTVDPGAKRSVLGLETPLPQRIRDHEHRLVERQRLFDEVERAHLDRAHGRLDVAVARNQHDLRIDMTFAQPLECRQTVESRQPDVEQNEIDAAAGHPLETLLTAGDGFDGISLIAKHASKSRTDARLVVDDEDSGLQHGSSMVNRVPRGDLSPTSMLPPCSAMIRRTIASPRPLPRRFVE